jgi:hypothetical protein
MLCDENGLGTLSRDVTKVCVFLLTAKIIGEKAKGKNKKKL